MKLNNKQEEYKKALLAIGFKEQDFPSAILLCGFSYINLSKIDDLPSLLRVVWGAAREDKLAEIRNVLGVIAPRI